MACSKVLRKSSAVLTARDPSLVGWLGREHGPRQRQRGPCPGPVPAKAGQGLSPLLGRVKKQAACFSQRASVMSVMSLLMSPNEEQAVSKRASRRRRRSYLDQAMSPLHGKAKKKSSKRENPGGDAGGARSSGAPGATMQRGRAAPIQLRANKQIDELIDSKRKAMRLVVLIILQFLISSA
jgi:hypothetical protein